MRALLVWLQLCRFPAVFTALADIGAGYLLTRSTWTPVSSFVLLLGASAGLYLSGMVFNDWFDIAQDVRERPHRPLPAGLVRAGAALLLAMLLMAAGIACAAAVGRGSLSIALLLAACILLYDGLLKSTPLGPVIMGSCRFLNLLLGASSAATLPADVWHMPQLWAALALGVYVAGVTWFARSEARESTRLGLLGGLAVVDVGLLMLALWFSDALTDWGIDVGRGAVASSFGPLLLLAVVAVTINRRAILALVRPGAIRVQSTVGLMLLSLIVLDALLIHYWRGEAGIPYTLATLALLAPTLILRRLMTIT